jgi:DNA-binding transcriptional MerR regulator
MRQLDLFGSVFETPPQEKKPEEKAVVSKKEENDANAAKAVSHSYSGNALRSERLYLEKLPTGKMEEVVGEMQVPAAEILPPTPASPSLSSLFNTPAVVEATEQEIQTIIEEIKEVRKEEQEIQGSNEAYYEPEKVEDFKDQVNTTEVFEAVSPIPEILIVDEVEISSKVSLIAEPPVVEVRKRAVSLKQKKLQVPELQRNGSVIFDDGKITVKIKNASPFPAPIVKVKKEKVKKPLQKRGRKSFKEIDAEVDLIEIPEDEILFQKQYYPISEVAKWFRVNTSLLRFWENEFDVLKPRKNRKGDRLFRPEDVKNLQLIYQLLRQRKYTIEGAKEYIKTHKKKADIQLQLTNTLQKFKSFLLDLKANLEP